MQPLPLTPETCKNGDLVPKEMVADWPEMSGKSVIAFQRWTGYRPSHRSRLVRKGKHIFQISEAPKARCVYCHDRQF